MTRVGVTPSDAPERVQYVTPSNPPRSDSSPLGPWALAARVDDAGVAALDIVGFDAELAAGGRQKVGDEDVGLIHELHQDGLALVGGEVDGDGPLASVGHLPQMRHAVDLCRNAPRRRRPAGIAEYRMLDLDSFVVITLTHVNRNTLLYSTIFFSNNNVMSYINKSW